MSSDYGMIAIRTAEDQDSGLYPVMGDGPEQVRLEPSDGEVEQYQAKHLWLQQYNPELQRDKTFIEVKNTGADLLVTDSRFAFACEDWARPNSHYIGFGLGATAAAVNNKYNEIKVKRETRGMVMMGHIRHDWLQNIGYRPWTGMLHPGFVRLGTVERLKNVDFEGYRHLTINFIVPKKVDAQGMARSIVQRASRYWLSDSPEELEARPDVRARLEELATDGPPELASGEQREGRHMNMPLWRCVSLEPIPPLFLNTEEE